MTTLKRTDITNLLIEAAGKIQMMPDGAYISVMDRQLPHSKFRPVETVLVELLEMIKRE